MSATLARLKENHLFIPAMIVPSLIMLVFSLFNMTAPLDPERAASAFRLGVVNQDEGLTSPPIRISSRMLGGLGENLPFKINEFKTIDLARAALEVGEVAAVVVFPPEFSKNAIGDENFEIEIWNAQHLSVSETGMATQLPMMIQTAMSGGVASLRLAFAKGQPPTGGFLVTAKVTTLYETDSPARLIAPFVMTFTTWFAAFVGALLLFRATRSDLDPKEMAGFRTLLPVINLCGASFILAIVIAAATGDWGLLIPVWWNVWLAAICLGWLMGGLFAVFGMISILVILPVTFYQSALGGAMIPVAAAPGWLRVIGEMVPFDTLGAAYRGVIHGAGFGLPLIWLGGAACVGLVLIWSAGLISARKS